MTTYRLLQSMRLAISPYRLQSRNHWRRFRQAGLKQARIEVPDASIRIWRGGKGPPVLMLQGFGGSALWQWYAQVNAFAPHYRLLIPDILGFGGTELRHGRMCLEQQSDVMIALLDHHQIDQIDIIGLSYGGFIGMWMAQAHPQRIRRLVLVDSPGIGYQPEDYDALLDRFGIQHISELLLPATPNDLRRLMELAWFSPPWAPDFALPDIHQHMFLDRVAQKRDLLEDLLGRLRTGDFIDPVPQRSQVIWGEADPLFPPHIGARMAALLSAEFHTMPRTRHAPNMERPTLFNRIVHRFLSRPARCRAQSGSSSQPERS